MSLRTLEGSLWMKKTEIFAVQRHGRVLVYSTFDSFCLEPHTPHITAS
jgi:hypothetical protein